MFGHLVQIGDHVGEVLGDVIGSLEEKPLDHSWDSPWNHTWEAKVKLERLALTGVLGEEQVPLRRSSF